MMLDIPRLSDGSRYGALLLLEWFGVFCAAVVVASLSYGVFMLFWWLWGYGYE